MEGSAGSPSVDRVIALLEADAVEQARSCLDTIQSHTATDRKETLRSLRSLAEDHPAMVGPLCPTLLSYLTDEERSVRLLTAKLFVTLAQSEPAAVLPAVDALAERLADGEEFYYVRARSAEVLGYVAVDAPEEVTDPETLADLRIGLSLDESEVKEKLAKALAYVALGNPDRLRHQVNSLAEHLDDEHELVRYHLCTALVVVGCEHPAKLADATEALTARLTDDNPYVRGRAAEALGVLARSEATDSTPAVEGVPPGEDDARSFVTERVQFARDDTDTEDHDGVGTVASIRCETDEIVESITAPDEGECPHCGLALPESGPPMCPGCGAPH